MRRTTFIAVAVLSSLAFSAWANDGVDLALRSKSLMVVPAGSVSGSTTELLRPGRVWGREEGEG